MADWPKHQLERAEKVRIESDGHVWEMDGPTFVACLEAGGWRGDLLDRLPAVCEKTLRGEVHDHRLCGPGQRSERFVMYEGDVAYEARYDKRKVRIAGWEYSINGTDINFSPQPITHKVGWVRPRFEPVVGQRTDD